MGIYLGENLKQNDIVKIDHICDECNHPMSYINWVQNGKVCIRCGDGLEAYRQSQSDRSV